MVFQICECTSPATGCRSSIYLPPCQIDRYRAKGLIMIVDGCPRGPKPTDKLVEKRDGYSLYEEVLGAP